MTRSARQFALWGLAAASLFWTAAAQAEIPVGMPMQPPPADSVLSGVTVTVPKVVERTRYGVVSSDVSMSVRVPYGDLDLTSPAGVTELNKRVAEAGNYVCHQLERMYPVGSPDEFYCVKEAISGAQPQIVAARAGPG